MFKRIAFYPSEKAKRFLPVSCRVVSYREMLFVARPCGDEPSGGGAEKLALPMAASERCEFGHLPEIPFSPSPQGGYRFSECHRRSLRRVGYPSIDMGHLRKQPPPPDSGGAQHY